MAILSLKVRVVDRDVVKTMNFDPHTQIYDACKIIREKLPEAQMGPPKDYGLFLADEDPTKGVWLENGKTLEYYLVRSGDLLEYRKKIRTLKVRMLDGSTKTLLVDDSQPVGQLMITICSRIGITNHDEYSLVRDMPPEEEKVNTLRKDDSVSKLGTLTLGRSKEKKMEQLRKQLHTDEELNWVDHSKTLREQGIDENETVLLRRKYFFSDRNIDARDPVQLNLLYVQCRDGILDGTHPVSKEEAFVFAGYQCQIQFGDYVENKHRNGFLDLQEFLPKEYVRLKDAEKRIFLEYKNLKGMSDLDAKVEYVKRCRSLKTYGVTFFLVKEKMKGKNKLAPRLLGINKDCVMRVDEKTKEVLKIYPLEQVRRWAASPNTFTLDFGDYQETYYSVQTTEGEKIGQLIGGYIDIILRKKASKDHFGVDGDEGSTMLEDMVTPAKATVMSHGMVKENYGLEGNIALPAVIRTGISDEMPYGTGAMQRAQFGAIGGQVTSTHVPQGQQPKVCDTVSRAQRALVGTIEASIRSVEKAEEELDKRLELPAFGDEQASKKWKETQMDVQKQSVTDHLAAMGAATAQVIQLTGAVADKVDHTAVGAAISTISSNIPDMTKGVQTIAALMEEEDQGSRLLDATRKLCRAISDLLGSVNPERMQPRQTVLAAAGRVGDYSHAMMQTIEEPSEAEKEFQDELVQLAKNVATSTAHLVLRAKTVSSKCDEAALQDRVIHSATQCAFATSQLVACARVVAPTIDSHACQEQLTDAAKQVARAVEQLLKDAEMACKHEQSLEDLREAASQVSHALVDLLDHIKTGPARAAVTEQEQNLDNIITTTDKLISYTGPTNEMVRQAKVLAEATTHLVTHIRGEAEAQAPDREHLTTAAKRLAEATTRMIEAAKACASVPHEPSRQMALKAAAEDLRVATSEAAEAQLRRKALQSLESASKQTVASATQVLTAAANSEPFNKSNTNRDALHRQCSQVSEVLPEWTAAIKRFQSQPGDRISQVELMSVSQEMLQPCARLVNVSRAAVPTVSDQAASMQLNSATQKLSESLSELRVSLTRVHETRGMSEIDSAMEMLKCLIHDLEDYRNAYVSNSLHPLPGETGENAINRLGNATKAVSSSVAQLLSAAAQADEQYVDVCARDVSETLHHLVAAVRAACATVPNIDGRSLLDSCNDVVDKSYRLLEEVKYCVAHKNHPDNQLRLAQVAKALTISLNNCISSFPGQTDIESAINTASSLVRMVSLEKVVPSTRSEIEVQEDFLGCASQLSEAANSIVSSIGGSPAVLSQICADYVTVLRRLVTVSHEIISFQQDAELKDKMIFALKAVVENSVRLLSAVKAYCAQPEMSNRKQQISSAARNLTSSINNMVDIYTQGSPWQKECDRAIRQIQAAAHLLNNPDQRVNSCTYFECLDMATDKSKSLGEGLSGITYHANQNDMPSFAESVQVVGDAVCGLGEVAAQAAYLIGIANQSSMPGTPPVANVSKFIECAQQVRNACDGIQSCRLGQAEILEAATTIATQTTALANLCREASSRSTMPVIKKHFINYARDIASSTTNLIKCIKVLDQNFSESNLKECARSTETLTPFLDNLVSFVTSEEIAGVPGRIGPEGRAAQQPIVSAGRKMMQESIEIIKICKLLAMNAKDPAVWQQLANKSKIVSDSIKGLVSVIRDKAPGQEECDAAIKKILETIRLIDQTALSAINDSLPRRMDDNETAFHEKIDNTARQILDRIAILQTAAKCEAESLGHCVSEMMSYFEPLTDACIGAASLTMNSQRQMALLDKCKTVAESQLQFLYCSKDSGGNPKATQFHAGVDESAKSLHDSLSELLQTVNEVVSEAGFVNTMISEISRAISRTDEPMTSGQLDYVTYQTRMLQYCREIGRLTQEALSKCYSNVNELGQIASKISEYYSKLAEDSRGACATASSPAIAQRIKSAVQELGIACSDCVKAIGVCRSNPSDEYSKKDLGECARVTAEKIALVLAALQAGARGTQACINAASTVSGIIGDLDTTIMFATAGTLNPEKEGEVFSDHREGILKTAKALVEDTKALVAGAASSQEQLAVAAQNAVRTIVKLSDVVKSGAAALTSQNSEAQVLVINAVKDVAAALASLIQATKNASGKGFNDPAMDCLKEAAKVMVTNVTSLLKTVKTVEDEHQRGTRALEAAIDAIGQEIKNYDTADHSVPKKPAKAEDLIRVAKPITDVTAKAMAAGQSCQQDDIITAANLSRRIVSDLLDVCLNTAGLAETPEQRYQCLEVGRDVALKVRELLQTLNTVIQKPTNESRQLLLLASRAIAQSVTELISQAEYLKGSDWVDPSDPTVIAENELLGAANSIEAAARKLAQLKPRQQVPEADETLNFDDQILEAAKSIVAAVTALVKAASAAQRELVAQGRVDARPHLQTEDYQWSEGLISAARMVAAATHTLCEAANALVQGHATEEKLISAAKQVAASTAHLLVACKVKSDASSKSMRRLQAAGNAVKTATEHLVNAARQGMQLDDERMVIISQRMVSGIAQVLDAREEVLRKEKELEEARVKLAAIQKAKYRAGDSHEGSPEVMYYSEF